MNHENENIPESRAEVSAVEAALAELRPRREGRFADAVKSRLKETLAEDAPAPEKSTATVRIPLTHYIRIAQFNAAAGGLLVGLFVGMVLGGAAMLFAVTRFDRGQSQQVVVPYPAPFPYVRMVLEDDPWLAPPERAILGRFDKEPSHGRRS